MAGFTFEKNFDLEVEFDCGHDVDSTCAEDDHHGTITITLDDTLEEFLNKQAQEEYGCDWEDLVNPDDE